MCRGAPGGADSEQSCHRTQPGVLVVGIDDSPPPPMERGDPESEDFRAHEVDILEAVAERLEVQLRTGVQAGARCSTSSNAD